MSSPEPVSVSREMQISEWSGLDHIPTPGVGPTYTTWTVRWDGYPKKNHGDLSRTRENGGWAKTTTARGSRRGFEAHSILVPLSLCALWCVAISLRCISESKTQSPMCGINCEKWVPGLSHLTPGHPTFTTHEGSHLLFIM